MHPLLFCSPFCVNTAAFVTVLHSETIPSCVVLQAGTAFLSKSAPTKAVDIIHMYATCLHQLSLGLFASNHNPRAVDAYHRFLSALLVISKWDRPLHLRLMKTICLLACFNLKRSAKYYAQSFLPRNAWEHRAHMRQHQMNFDRSRLHFRSGVCCSFNSGMVECLRKPARDRKKL